MRKIFAFILLALMEPSISFADSAKCYSIKNSDLKYDCLAKAKNIPSQCYAIKDSNLKNSCLARTKQQKIHCYKIQNTDLKHQCLSDK